MELLMIFIDTVGDYFQQQIQLARLLKKSLNQNLKLVQSMQVLIEILHGFQTLLLVFRHCFSWLLLLWSHWLCAYCCAAGSCSSFPCLDLCFVKSILCCCPFCTFSCLWCSAGIFGCFLLIQQRINDCPSADEVPLVDILALFNQCPLCIPLSCTSSRKWERQGTQSEKGKERERQGTQLRLQTRMQAVLEMTFPQYWHLQLT